MNQKGFTIVELLIATTIFSIVLLLVTTGIIQITSVYSKGVTENNTQTTAQGIVDSISQAIQFGGGSVTTTPPSPNPGTSYAFCIGGERFSYSLGFVIASTLPPNYAQHQGYHALVEDSYPGCSGSTPAQDVVHTQNVSGKELLNTMMRLSNFSISQVGNNLYQIEVKVVYGNDITLSQPTTTSAGCASGGNTQFCAVSEINTVVTKRVP